MPFFGRSAVVLPSTSGEPGLEEATTLDGDCLALFIADAVGIRSAIRERWKSHSKQAAAREARRRAELERKARADLDRLQNHASETP